MGFGIGFRGAFTLAEVLITLGIIGVVAAMTMPSLIAKHQKMVLKNQFKKAYSTIENAINLTSAQNGIPYDCYASFNDGFAYYNSECSQFWDDLFKNLKILDSCIYKSEGCGVVYKQTSDVLADGGSISNNNCSYLDAATGNEVNILNDGSYLITSKTGANGHHNTYFTLDVNGAKGPNKWGYDVFYVMLYRKNLLSNVVSMDEVCAIKEKDGLYFKEILRE